MFVTRPPPAGSGGPKESVQGSCNVNVEKIERKSPPTCMIVYHIPKTGGTTLELYLQALADSLQWSLYKWDGPAVSNPDAEPFLTRLLSFQDKIIHEGHLTPGFERMTGTERCAKMTVLRDPIDRVVSAFYFHRKYDYVQIASESMREETWRNCLFGTSSTTCALRHEYMNDIVRRFACKSSWWNSFHQSRYVAGETFPNDLNEGDLEAAKRRLLSFDRVCFLSTMRKCFEEFVGSTFGISDLHLPNVRKNKGQQKPPLSEQVKRQIMVRNRLDIQLYAWALDVFNGTAR